MNPRLPPLRGNTRAERRALRLQNARGAQVTTGDDMRETAAAGQDTGSSAGGAWFEPTGSAEGERNAHRLRGWSIAVAAALLLWGVIAVVVWGAASLF
jgi:disulfide bond formation protein DsbB